MVRFEVVEREFYGRLHRDKWERGGKIKMTNNNSRMNKFEKRRRNTKFINYFLTLAAVLAVFLIGFWIFGGNDESADDRDTSTSEADSFFLETEEDDNENSTDNEAADEQEENDESGADSEDNNREEDESASEEAEENNENDEVETVETEPSDDDVEEAIMGNWSPIGTEQTGPHTTKYEDGSQDRIEIKRAASMVTGIPEDELIEIWIGNGGHQKVVATVSNRAQTENYRVFMSWVDGEGWQPTKLETLKQ